MIGHWIAFWIILTFLLLLLAWSIFLIIRQKRNKAQLTQNDFKRIEMSIYYLLVDFFYLACFNDWLIWIFIFGGVVILVEFISITEAFMISVTKNKIPKVLFILDIMLCLGVTIYLIYVIPNEQFQTIILTMTSAVYGGFVTLLGVAWTIKMTQKDRQEDILLHA